MPDALQIAATGMRAHQTELDTIANNVANVNTNGFRRNLVSFATVAAATVPTDGVDGGESVGADAPTGAGTLAQVSLSMLSGTLQHTNEPLDIAIDGNGFLEVSRADGTPAFTRNGRLKLDANGQLTMADGTPLASQIMIPPDTRSIQIDEAGRVSATIGTAGTVTDVGQIEMADFSNPAGLQAKCAAGLRMPMASGASGRAI
jgi:flagellar basal-body rod protein FlgG